MDLDVFIKSLQNTTENISALLEKWDQLNPDLTAHYVDELVMLIARIPTALMIATSKNVALTYEVVRFEKELQLNKFALQKLGVDVDAILNFSTE